MDSCRCGCGNVTPIAKRSRKELGHIKGKHIDYLLGHKMRGVTGSRHFNFKNANAGYKAYHLRVTVARGKAKACEDCGDTNFVEWASLTKKYEDTNDYKALCRKCHHKLDHHNIKGWKTRRGGDVLA